MGFWNYSPISTSEGESLILLCFVFRLAIKFMRRSPFILKHYATLYAVIVAAMITSAKGEGYYSGLPVEVEVVPTAYSSKMEHYYKSIWESPKTDYDSNASIRERDYEERSRARQEAHEQRMKEFQEKHDAANATIEEMREKTQKIVEESNKMAREQNKLNQEKMQRFNDELLKRANERAENANREKTNAIEEANLKMITLSLELLAADEINSYLIHDNKRIYNIRNLIIPLIKNDKENQYPQLIFPSDIENLRDKKIYSDKEILVALSTLTDDSKLKNYSMLEVMNSVCSFERAMELVNEAYHCIPISYHPETTSTESSLWSRFWSK
jgi:hypothetical protein